MKSRKMGQCIHLNILIIKISFLLINFKSHTSKCLATIDLVNQKDFKVESGLNKVVFLKRVQT